MKHGFETKVTFHLFFLVSIHVMLDFFCDQCVVCLIILLNNLATLRMLLGTMFMLTILPNYVSKE